MSIRKRKEKAADTLVKLRKIYKEGHEIRVEGNVLEWSELHKRVASSMNELESGNMKLHTMPGTALEAARLGQVLCEVRKEADE